ncbi:MAG: F0F1 ATP synthase subunit delta [Spirochaetota bacterium]
MQFDLFTFFASLFNFLVLLALLRIFLFKRITNAMDTREQRIADNWDEAERTKHEAEELRAEYEQRMEEADDERDELLRETREEIDRQKKEQLEQARKEVDEKRKEWLESVRADQSRLVRSIRESVARAAVDSTQAALGSLAGVSLEQEMVARLLEEIASGDDDLSRAVAGSAVEITTSHELDEKQRDRITTGISEVAEPASVEFSESDDLICGVRMRIGDREIGWSVADHIAGLEGGIEELIEAR